MYETDCPFCGAEIEWPEQPRLRQIVYCPTCQGLSKVSSISPVELDEATWVDSGKMRREKRRQIPSARYSAYDLVEEEDLDMDEPVHKFNGKRSSHFKRRHKK